MLQAFCNILTPLKVFVLRRKWAASKLRLFPLFPSIIPWYSLNIWAPWGNNPAWSSSRPPDTILEDTRIIFESRCAHHKCQVLVSFVASWNYYIEEINKLIILLIFISFYILQANHPWWTPEVDLANISKQTMNARSNKSPACWSSHYYLTDQ